MKPQWLRHPHRSGVRIAIAIAALPVLLLTGSSRAQDIYAYPAKGQSQSQQDRDRYECHSWAVKQTGFDPSRAQAAASDTHAVAEPASATAGACRQRSRARRRARRGRRRYNRQCGHRSRRGRGDGRIGRRNAPARSTDPAKPTATGRYSVRGQFAAKPTQRLSSSDGGVPDRPRLHGELSSASQTLR